MNRKVRALLVVLAGAAALALWIPRAGRAARAVEPACAGCEIPWDTMIRLEIARYLAAGVAGLIAVASGDTGWYAEHTGWLARAWPSSLLHAALWLPAAALRRPSAPTGS